MTAPREVCPCETDVEDPGPHIEGCPYSDPDYDPEGLPDPKLVRGVLLEGFHRAVARKARRDSKP